MSKELLTEDEKHLSLFDDGVVINKSLLKWKRAEDGMKKTESPSSTKISIANDGTHTINSLSYAVSNNDVDSNIDAGTRWLPLYQTPEGLNFDEIATAGIKDLTRLLVEKKIKYVMGGYGSFGTTANSIEYGDTSPFYSGVKTDNHKSNIKKEKRRFTL